MLSYIHIYTGSEVTSIHFNQTWGQAEFKKSFTFLGFRYLLESAVQHFLDYITFYLPCTREKQ